MKKLLDTSRKTLSQFSKEDLIQIIQNSGLNIDKSIKSLKKIHKLQEKRTNKQ